MERTVIVRRGTYTIRKIWWSTISHLTASDLGGIAIKEALNRAGVKADEVDEVIIGTVLQAGQGQIPSRQAATKAGLPW